MAATGSDMDFARYGRMQYDVTWGWQADVTYNKCPVNFVKPCHLQLGAEFFFSFYNNGCSARGSKYLLGLRRTTKLAFFTWSFKLIVRKQLWQNAVVSVSQPNLCLMSPFPPVEFPHHVTTL